MASVKTLVDEAGSARAYKVRWRTESGMERGRTFPLGQKEAARKFAVQVEADKMTGTAVDARGAWVTVSEYAADWAAIQVHAPRSQRRVQAALKPLLAEIGAERLAKVRQSHIQAWLKARCSTVDLSTVRTDLTWVRGLFRAAVADRLIGFNPCDGVKAETPPKRDGVLPDAAGVAAIAARLPVSWAFIGPLGARTGLRPGELLGLSEDQVDWLHLQITVDRQLSDGAVMPKTKTSASRRVVPVDSETMELLSAHLVAWPLEGPDRLIFHRAGGRPLDHRTVNGTWQRNAVRVGWPGVRLHDMRHYYATAMLAAGLSFVDVAALLGHADPAITARVYAHVPADAADRVRRAASAAFGVR